MSHRILARSTVALVALAAATSASAGTITLELPESLGGVGSDVTITVTVETDGTEIADPFDAILLQVGWDPAVLQVENAGVSSAFGNAMQVVTEGPGAGGFQMTGTGGDGVLAGPPEPFCANTGNTCTIVTQSATLDAIALDEQTLVGTLVFEVIGFGSADLQVTEVFDLDGQMELVIVPEPGTAALLGLGLAGLAGTVRRRR